MGRTEAHHEIRSFKGCTSNSRTDHREDDVALLRRLPAGQALCHHSLMRTIRRYSNRKLYDTQDSHYVTLAQITAIIRAGEEITVTSKETGKDITAATMAQIIFEETKSGQPLPVRGLRKIIVSGLPVE
jgi:polyhydroxyalkanoate synthesis repressor PhaR